MNRQRRFDLIETTGSTGVVLLSGNVHYAEISKTDEGPYPLYDFTSSGMTHTTPAYAELRNRRRIAGPFTGFNFGLVEIDWEGPTGPQLRLTAFGVNGEASFDKTIKLEELAP